MKVHRQGWDTRHRRRLGMSTLCGHPFHLHVERNIVNDDCFPLVPDTLRCQVCDRAKATVALHWARLHVDEWRVGFELMFLAFARFAEDLVNLKSDHDWRHRCWFDNDRRVCACGRASYFGQRWRVIGLANVVMLPRRLEEEAQHRVIRRMQREHDELLARIQAGERLR